VHSSFPIFLLILASLYGKADNNAVFAVAQFSDLAPPDTIPPDTLVLDSTANDSLYAPKVKLSADTLDAPVKYKALDSIWYILRTSASSL
jgi:hypothetical protein